MNKFQSRNFAKSITYALNGVRLAFSSQRNFRKHVFIGVILLTIAILLKVSVVEFCIVLYVNAFVLIIEMINTVIEFVIDAYYKNKWAKLAKLSKDVAAGAVLISAVTSVTICFVIFINKVLDSI